MFLQTMIMFYKK